MTRVLITGGAGFIGSHLASNFQARDDDVRVLDNLTTGSSENLHGMELELIQGDIRDRGTVDQAMRDIDYVFHYAAMVSAPESIHEPSFCYEVNLMGSLNVLRSAQLAGVQKVVLASSAAVYGEKDDPVSEESTLDPKTPYASSKIAMEGLARMFTRAYNLPTVCFRYFNVFGPRQSPDSPYAAAIPLFMDALHSKSAPIIHGDGLQTRDFVYIDDVVRANLLAIEKEQAEGGVFNIAGDGPITILELVDLISAQYPDSRPPEFGTEREGDIRHSSASQVRAQEALGYRPEIGLEQGLQRTVQWFRSQRNL